MSRRGLCPVALALFALALSGWPSLTMAQEGSARRRHAPSTLSAQLGLAVGLWNYSAEMNSGAERRQLTTRALPALALKLRWVVEAPRLLLGVQGVYLTSVASRAQESGVSGPGREAALRMQRLQVEGGGQWRIAPALGLALEGWVGFGLQGLYTPVPLGVPNYTLAGPGARLGVHWTPIAAISLWVSPGAQWIPYVTQALRARAGASGSGTALGVEAGVGYRLDHGLGLQLAYHESRTTLSGLGTHALEGRDRSWLLELSARWL